MRFAQYMDWVLHDLEHGAYGSGRLQVGPRGDFATSPSLGSDFAALLAPQLAQWLELLAANRIDALQPRLSLLEAGPGEGDLAADLAHVLTTGWPQLRDRLELVLIEPNAGMAARQRQRLQGCPLPVRWCSFAELAAQPLHGVLLAHEVLDALPVERLIYDGKHWRPQLVQLLEGERGEASLLLSPGERLDPAADAALLQQLQQRGLLAPDAEAVLPLPSGWTTEVHNAASVWLADAARAVDSGVLLVIDYALEAHRYNAPNRRDGTLMAYRGQRASGDPLLEPGRWDLTAHLCLESLDAAARACGWRPAGACRQGQALLSLGLAQRLHHLQELPPDQLSAALAAREALLRLVDPAGLGEFRWISYHCGDVNLEATALYLQEPSCVG